MSNISKARADWVKASDGAKGAIVVTLCWEGKTSKQIVLDHPLVLESFRETPDHALAATLLTLSVTQGTLAEPNIYDFDGKTEAADAETQAFIDAYKQCIASGVAIAEWHAPAE